MKKAGQRMWLVRYWRIDRLELPPVWVSAFERFGVAFRMGGIQGDGSTGVRSLISLAFSFIFTLGLIGCITWNSM